MKLPGITLLENLYMENLIKEVGNNLAEVK